MDKAIVYREDFQAYWPVFDHKPERCFDFINNGLPAIDVAIKHVKKFDCCIQAGGHLGFWPNKLATMFKKVITFEPDPIVYRCLQANVKYHHIIALNMALGKKNGVAYMDRGCSAGSTKVTENGKIEVLMRTIDSFDLAACDAILLDVEAYESQILEGAEQIIKEFDPVILVEELPRNVQKIYDFMLKIGYSCVDHYGNDGIWKKI